MAELIEARQRSYTGTPTRSNTPITPALPLLPPGLGRNMTPKRDHPESNLGLEATSTGQDDDMKVFDKTVAVPDISPEPGTTSSKPLKGAYGSAGKSEKAEQADLAHRGSPMKSKKNKDSTVRQEKTALKKTPDTVPTHTSAPETTSPPKRSVLPPATVSNENEPKAKRQTPGKLDINAATTASAQEKIDEEGGTRTRASSKASVSIPTTSTAALKGSPVKKSAPSKILRVVQTPKTETPPPLSASPASSVPIPHVPGVVGARSSRQASVASINLPSTPVNELASETASVTSASLSRASSPPPGSKVVPAPRMKSKSQAKKERHERAKQLAEEKAAAEEVTKPSDEPVQEPILGRKKKAKKAKAVVSTAASLPASTKTKKAEKSEPAETKEPTQSTPAPDASQPAIEHPREATPTTAPVQPERVERPVTPEEAKRRVPTAASIIADLQVNGDLLQHALEFFKPMSTLAQRGEITRADLENLERKIPYSKKDHENIAKHIPVQLGGVDESRPSERALVMPEGVLWNLTKDLERRYLELEERVKEAKGASKYRHKRQTNKRGGAGNPMAASSNFLPSFANVVNNAHAKSNGSTKGHGGADFQGGASGTLSPMDDPVKFLNQFVLPTDSSVGSSMRGGEAIGTAKMASAIPANLLQDLGEAGRLAAELLEGYIVQSFNGSGVSMGGRGANVEDIEREMFESRKQVEKLEKQLNTLVKKNRKVLGGSH